MDRELTLEETKVQIRLFLFNVTSKQDTELLYQEIIEFIETASKGFIWNNEKISLSQPALIEEGFYSVNGNIDFGDCVEDEWYMVYLLFELSRKFNKRVAAKITDIDGEFMIIHAANHLPEWASTSDEEELLNRVFIYDGRLKIIPPADSPAQITYLPAKGPITDPIGAVKTLIRFGELCDAPEPMQNSIKLRIANFSPDVIIKSLYHRATCLIPSKLAILLNSNPGLIGAAINRFCDKDPNDLKLCRTFDTFIPNDLVNYRVLFTKHLYGKLKYCKHQPDLKNWPSLKQVFDSLDAEKTTCVDKKQVQERYILGFKLTCAFEILSRSLLSTRSQDQQSFERFIERLNKLGYFKGYIEHSVNYNELYEKAKASFHADRSESIEKITTLENLYQTDAVSLMELKESLSKSDDLDDNDDWLCVEAPQLDDYLEMYSKGECSSAYDFRVLASAFHSFVNCKPTDNSNKNDSSQQKVDFKPIDPNTDDKLINLDLGLIEGNLKDLLSTKKEEESESESFYEIDDEALEKIDDQLVDYMSEMDEKLKSETNLGRKDTDQELDIDLNLVSNAIESYSNQLGISGPVSNILKSLGL